MSTNPQVGTVRSRRPTLSLARVVALALIVSLMAWLVYLRFAPDPDRVSVPTGAGAGDLVLEPCEYDGESGSIPADCGTLVVPENAADPGSPLIALPVTRVRTESPRPAEPVFFLGGGPGATNMWFDVADRYTENHDVVMLGYRGVDGSVRLDCPEVDATFRRSTDVLSDGFFRAYADAYRACARRFAEDGVDVAQYGLVQQIEDIETARVALGYDRINLLSESAGTRTAIIYGWRHPQSIHRSLMVGVNPPGAFLWDAEITDEQIGRYSDLCAADPSCRARTDDLAVTMRETAADIPERWMFLPIKDSNVRTLSMFGLFETAPTGPASAPMMIDNWLSAAEGDASGFWFASVLADLVLPELFVRGQYASAGMLDAQASRTYFASGPGDLDNLGRAATSVGWGGGRLADAWPPAPDEAEYRQVRPSDVETLLVNGDLDVSTPPQVATDRLLPSLTNGREVVLRGFGHTNSFFSEQPGAGTRLVTTFFDTGRVDDSLYEPQRPDFTPPVTHTGIAKLFLGTLLVLAAWMVLSLLLLARRVRRRGRVGPTAGALLRSVHAVVLAVGGWCLGALVVLTALPAVRIFSGPVVVLSVALPVALGVYGAWVHRDWSPRSKGTGLGVTTVGAFAGAFVGYAATGLPLALVTAVLAAVAGANFALILLDMRQERPDAVPGSQPGSRSTTNVGAGAPR